LIVFFFNDGSLWCGTHDLKHSFNACSKGIGGKDSYNTKPFVDAAPLENWSEGGFVLFNILTLLEASAEMELSRIELYHRSWHSSRIDSNTEMDSMPYDKTSGTFSMSSSSSSSSFWFFFSSFFFSLSLSSTSTARLIIMFSRCGLDKREVVVECSSLTSLEVAFNEWRRDKESINFISDEIGG